MKTLIVLSALAALAVPAVASAQVAQGAVIGNVAINGFVDARCSFVTGSATITLNEMAAADGTYNSVADAKTATLNGFCNGMSSTMTVVSTPISRTGGGSPPTGFVDVVNYTATASVTPAGAVAPVTASDASNGTPSAAAAVSLFSGNILVTLSGSGTAAGKLVAGAYTGNVAVTLTPGL